MQKSEIPNAMPDLPSSSLLACRDEEVYMYILERADLSRPKLTAQGYTSERRNATNFARSIPLARLF